MRYFWFTTIVLGFLTLGTGCAKNVDRIQFTKWGNSFIPRGTGVDTTAQGGATQNGVIPQSPSFQNTKASVGGAYYRTFATSSHYRMVGGFHVTAGQ